VPVPIEQIKPGLVMHLDTSILRTRGGSLTNAERAHGQDKAVVGPHYFLILEVNPKDRTCLAVPLFSHPATGNEKLNEALKSGEPDRWRGQDSYFSRWQHWRIPLQAIPDASKDEESTPVTRRYYAAGSLENLQNIAAWQEDNRQAFRAVEAPRPTGGLTDAERERRRQALERAKGD
jgi:hypothetical protein